MSNDNHVSRRLRDTPRQPTATHKFPVGANVLHKGPFRSDGGAFRVVRHLPDGGTGLQYRIKSDRDGQ